MKTLALTLSSLSLFVLTGLAAEAKEPLIPKVSTIKVTERTKKAKAKQASEISREGIRAPLQGIASVKESGFRVAYQPTDDPTFKEVQERYKASRAFETITAEINESLVLPGVLDVQMASCGIPNAFYDPSGGRIIMCYELVTYFIEVFTESGLSGEELDKAVHGAVLFTFYHEIGHSLVDVLELPITGREEDAVDQLATVVLVNEGESGAQMALAGAKWFLIESDKEKDDEMVFWAVHSLHKQRYFDISCMVYGFAPHTFGDLVGSKGIPRGRAMRCPSQYQRIERSWGKLLAPHTRSESESPEEDAPRESDEVAKAEEPKPAAGDAAETMEAKCAKVYDHIISLMKSAGASESDIEAMQRERSSNLRECLHDLKTEPKTEAPSTACSRLPRSQPSALRGDTRERGARPQDHRRSPLEALAKREPRSLRSDHRSCDHGALPRAAEEPPRRGA